MYCLYRFSSRSRQERERSRRMPPSCRVAAGGLAARVCESSTTAASIGIVSRRANSAACAAACRSAAWSTDRSRPRERALGVGHDQRLIVLQDGAKAVARRAGAARIVEREELRRRCGRRRAIVGALESLGEAESCQQAGHRLLARGRRSSTTQSPSPSVKAVPIASARRPAISGPTVRRSTTTSGSARGRRDRCRRDSSSSRCRIMPSDADAHESLSPEILDGDIVGDAARQPERKGDAEPGARGQREHGVASPTGRCPARSSRPHWGKRVPDPAPTAAADSRRSPSRCRRSSATSSSGSSARSRRPETAPRPSRRRASPSARGTAARTPTAIRRSGAGLRRRSCRTPARTCPIPRAGDDGERAPGNVEVECS